MWDADGTCVKTLEGHTETVSALALGPDGTLYSGSVDDTIKVWNTDGTCVLTDHTNTVWALAVKADGTLYSGSWDRTIKVWEPQSVRGNLELLTHHWRCEKRITARFRGS